MNALATLRGLQEARGLLPDAELAHKARAVLERSDLKPFTIPDFLQQHGFFEWALLSAVGSFGKAVAEAYRAEHGVDPLMVEIDMPGVGRRQVHEYLEADRPLLERTFQEWRARV